MYQSRVEKLEHEITTNQDQIRLLSARSEELKTLNDDLSSKNESLSKFEKEYENLDRANNELQDKLKVRYVFMIITTSRWVVKFTNILASKMNYGDPVSISTFCQYLLSVLKNHPMSL